MMDLLNPLWLHINKMGCNWNRTTVLDVKSAGFVIRSLEPFKIYSTAAPTAFPLRMIKAELPNSGMNAVENC